MEMDDFYVKIQILFMKKDKECGQLKSLASRTTVDSVSHIEDVCKSVTEIFTICGINTNDTDLTTREDCIQAFKYLLLNTNFKCQEHLAEDITNGHLVDMCPPLSPYLFIQLIWHLKFEGILTESLLHMPIDLCVEILDIVECCIDFLDFERGSRTLIALLLNSYKAIISTRDKGSPTQNIAKSLDDFLAHILNLVNLLSETKITRLNELSGLKKYERYGLLMRKILQLTRDCLSSIKDGVVIDPKLDQLYKVTFGRGEIIHHDSSVIEPYVLMFNKILFNLLLNKFKEIDGNIYLGWAELEEAENKSISLQRAIGIECYYFLNSFKDDDRLADYRQLIEGLQKLSSKPEPVVEPSSMSLQDLCAGIDEGKQNYVKELIKRYREWDDSTFSYIQKNQSAIEKDDYLNLLDYLSIVLMQPDQESFKDRVYGTVTKIFFRLDLPDVIDIVVEYILKHNASDILECLHTEESFKDFITHHTNLRTSRNLRTMLFFIIQNPKKILTILVQISIGHPAFGNVMISPDDFFLLSPIMQIRDKNGELLLTNTLTNVLSENSEWNPKKFGCLMQVLVDRQFFTVDDIVNKIFIPCLKKENLPISNVKTALNFIRNIKEMCTKETHVHTLIQILAKKISNLRKDINHPKYLSSEVLTLSIRLIEHFVKDIDKTKKSETIDKLEEFCEPIDKPYFASLWFLTKRGVGITEIISDYARYTVTANEEKSTELTNEDYLRHLILRCTEAEYMKFGSEATIIYWNAFGWVDEADAYDVFTRLTAEACLFCLEYPDDIPPESFAFFIKCLAKFSRWFINIDIVGDTTVLLERIYQSLDKNIRLVDRNARHSSYSNYYTILLCCMNNAAKHESIIDNLQELIQAIETFGNQCLEAGCARTSFELSHSAEMIKFQSTYHFICTSLDAPTTMRYKCFSKMDRTLFPEYYTNAVKH